jgi:hypothetical protein
MPKNGPSSLKNLGLLAGVLLAALLYFPLNHNVANTHILTNSLDARLPIVPVFAIPYLALPLIFWLVFLYTWLRGEQFIKLAAVLIIVLGLSDIIYLIFPTHIPRPQHLSGFFASLVQFIYRHDQPFNDLPSEHAAMATLLVFYFWPRGWWFRIGSTVFAVSIILATVLIKQHSILGAACGILLTLLVWAALPQLNSKWQRRKEQP